MSTACRLSILVLILLGTFACALRAETIVALTSSSELLLFDSESPSVIVSRTAITGLQPNETLVGIDLRPATGELYGLSNQGRIYTLNLVSAVATLASTLAADPADLTDPFAALTGTNFGIDFNPVPDRLRVVSDSGQNLRINVANGLVTTDTPLAYAPGEPHVGEAPNIVDAAYVNNVAGATATTLFGIDATLNITVRQGGPDGNPLPNGGQLFVTGKFGKQGAAPKGFEITPAGNAFVAAKLNFPDGSSTTHVLVKIDLVGGDVSHGFIGDGNVPIEDIAAAPSIQFSKSAYAVNKSAGTALIVVTRTAPQLGTATVFYSTSDGTAHDGTDYTAASGTLTFGPGETSKTFTVPITNTTTANDDLILNLSLSNPTGGVALGGPKTATLRINRSKPDEVAGPQVVNVGLTGPSRGITGMVVQFDKDLDPIMAVTLANYSMKTVGKGSKSLVFNSATYDPVKRNVTLTTEPFEQTVFKGFKIKIKGRKEGITDSNGNPLASKNGKTGKDVTFAFKIFSSEVTTIKDSDGDKATITISGGGHLDGIVRVGKSFLFQAWIVDPISIQSKISGTVTPGRKGNGILVIAEIIGLDKKEFTPLLNNPSFQINRSTFSPNATGNF